MLISKISLEVASQLSSCSTFELIDFFHKAEPGQIFSYCHYHFYYSFPEFGRHWENGLSCEFHQVETCCSKCQAQPSRNYAGVGSHFLSMTKDRKASFVCDDCAEGLKVYGLRDHYRQLALLFS